MLPNLTINLLRAADQFPGNTLREHHLYQLVVEFPLILLHLKD